MLFKEIGIIDKNFNFQPDRFVAVEGARITYIGAEAPTTYEGDVYDGRRKVLTPAFYNSHGHTPMVLMRGYGENMVLQDWLAQKIYPFEARWNAARIYNATLLGIAEMLRGGTVSVTDMYMYTEAMAQAFLESGFKANLDAAIVCFDDRDYRATKEYREQEALFALAASDQSGRLRVDVGLHAEYTSTPKIVRGVAEYAQERNAGINLHLSETKTEHQGAIERRGKTPAAYFEELGIFTVPVTAAHCVWVNEADMDILERHQVTVAACPVSHLKLASGFMPLPALLDRQINVGLGTDSASSNNSLDMVEEMKFLALVYKGKLADPQVITPQQALYAATAAGARGQGRHDCGAIAVGNRADLVVFDFDSAHLQPVHNVVNQLVYAANGNDVVLTMVDGKVLYREGTYTTIDLEKVIFEATADKNAMLAEIK